MNTPKTPNISILLVDDHPVVRQGYRRVLENQSDFRVVAESVAGASIALAYDADGLPVRSAYDRQTRELCRRELDRVPKTTARPAGGP